MKKTIAILLVLAALLSGCTAEAPAETTTTPTTEATEAKQEITWMTLPADRAISAAQYFVYDCEAGRFVVNAEDTSTKIYPASVTKLFTAYVALQYLDAGKTITAGDELNKVVAGSSVAEIKKGDSLTAEQLVAGMLLPSGNDAAYILAAAAGRAMYGEKANEVSTDDAVNRFVKEMNDQAKLLGMTGTNFANPDGIHSDSHYSTYADLAILGTLALEDPIILKYAVVSNASHTLQSGSVTWKNTNAIIDPASEYYCPACIGLKTGQTPYAGSCLLSAFEFNGHSFIVGVFGCKEVDDRFPDTLQLFNNALMHYYPLGETQ